MYMGTDVFRMCATLRRALSTPLTRTRPAILRKRRPLEWMPTGTSGPGVSQRKEENEPYYSAQRDLV